MSNREVVLRSRWLGNPVFLFTTLLLQIVLQPLPLSTAVPLKRLLLSLTLVGAVNMVCIKPRDRHIALGLGIPALLAIWAARVVAVDLLTLLAFLFVILLYVFIVVRMLTRITRAESVNWDTIFLAASCFLLIGTIWALFYHTIVLLDPSAISGISESTATNLIPDLFYFSFVTLTTLGYGDIIPVAPIAKSVAILESVVGTLFVAIVIAIIVGKYVARGLVRD
jgi:hypothetical protein